MIREGRHPPVDVWSYTPAQAYAYAQLTMTALKQRKADLLSIMALAARGEVKKVGKIIAELSKE
ncbi:hypothetical protein [Bradyrhizobium viridifuturi]|uniref:hypothetical protein n=1 Tax=Bradyrhizobium viridifuturi TaxID=1654716 RepID=UPI000FE14901|nr:hypothetical protein [Bradyrhizobium viridifuturi]